MFQALPTDLIQKLTPLAPQPQESRDAPAFRALFASLMGKSRISIEHDAQPDAKNAPLAEGKSGKTQHDDAEAESAEIDGLDADVIPVAVVAEDEFSVSAPVVDRKPMLELHQADAVAVQDTVTADLPRVDAPIAPLATPQKPMSGLPGVVAESADAPATKPEPVSADANVPVEPRTAPPMGVRAAQDVADPVIDSADTEGRAHVPLQDAVERPIREGLPTAETAASVPARDLVAKEAAKFGDAPFIQGPALPRIDPREAVVQSRFAQAAPTQSPEPSAETQAASPSETKEKAAPAPVLAAAFIPRAGQDAQPLAAAPKAPDLPLAAPAQAPLPPVLRFESAAEPLRQPPPVAAGPMITVQSIVAKAAVQAMMVSERKMKPMVIPDASVAQKLPTPEPAALTVPLPVEGKAIAPDSAGLLSPPVSTATSQGPALDVARAPLSDPAALPRSLETAQAIARQIATQISPQTMTGPAGFEVALSPEELGSVRIRLVAADSGSVLIVHAERPETMDLMRRHIVTLEHDLRSLGHDSLTVRFAGTGAGGSFGNAPSGQQFQHQDHTPRGDGAGVAANPPDPDAAVLAHRPSAALVTDHLDLRL